jgi:hypothetical protein
MQKIKPNAMEVDIKKLNRFTTLPFLMDLLKRKKISLLNPNYWEDYNDRETMEAYRKSVNAESIYALCLTHKSETIHHWNAFANGASGCCIEFSPTKLFEILHTNNVQHGKTEYVRINELANFNPEPQQFPFLKRQPFKPENEYRLIATSNEKQTATFDIDIPLQIIRRITISATVPHSVFESIKAVLLQIAPELKSKIYHSTLYNNNTWINHFREK